MALVVPIVADTSGLTRGLNQGQSSLRKFGKVAAFAAGAAAIGGLVAVVSAGTKKFIEQEKAVAQTNARLKSTGAVANVTAKDVVRLSDAIANKTGLDDDNVHAMENMLLTFTNIRNELGKNNDIFNQATMVTADLSVAFEKDLQTSAIMVGKALNDPIKGVTALGRAGVQFTAGQKETIKKLVESGRLLDAQKMILKELNTQVGGSAEAYGKTLPGQLSIAKQAFEQVSMSLVAKFLPSVTSALSAVAEFLSAIDAQPTLTAKIKLIVSAIGNVTWTGIQSVYTWWTQQGRVELPARVILTPSGKMQFDAFFARIEEQAAVTGKRAGRAITETLFGVFSNEGRSRAGSTMTNIANAIFESAKFLFRVMGVTISAEFIDGIVKGIGSMFAEKIAGAIRSALGDVIGLLKLDLAGVGNSIADRIQRAVRAGAPRLANVLTKTVRDAINSARQGLASAASSLGGTLSTVLSATFRLPGGMNAAEILAKERELEDERLAIEEQRLKDAANAEGATLDDQLNLREFYLNKEKTLRDRALQDEINNRQKGIDDLTEKFNQGLITAADFASSLRGIIGSDLGSELGSGFAAAFARELESVILTAQDIVKAGGAGVPITAGGDTSATDALKSENQRRFESDLAAWQKRYDTRKKQAEDYRKRAASEKGSTITPNERKEINAIMAEWTRSNKKPVRSAYGLAMGGILKQPTFVAGEAGKEAVIPLESSSAGKILREAIGGTQQSGMVVYVTVQGSVTSESDLAETIRKQLLRTGQRNGTIFGGYA